LGQGESEPGSTGARDRLGITAAPGLESVLPGRGEGDDAGAGITVPGRVIPELGASSGNTAPADGLCETLSGVLRALEHEPQIRAAFAALLEANGVFGAPPPPKPPIGERLILDLCAGSGAWSEPYRAAGYPVRRVTLPADDVRSFIATRQVWGVLAAPPCTEFSLAKNGHARDFVEGLSCVNAALRIVWTARPRWWALENPVGLLGRWLGKPHDVFEPCDFGDPWSKRTALWGEFQRPTRGPRVQAVTGGGPLCVECHPDDPRCCSLAEHRAVTPPGFARAFFEANP
jgi:hypothetical protein